MVIVFELTLQLPGNLMIFELKFVPIIDKLEQMLVFVVEFMLLLYYDGKTIFIESVIFRITLIVVIVIV